MNPRIGDTNAQAVVRGSSLRAVSRVLGMGGLSVLALSAAQTPPLSGEAKRKQRKNRKKRKQGSDRRCKRQVNACEAFIASKCTIDPDDRACQDPIACCTHLEQCRMADFVACLADAGIGALDAL